MVGRVGSPSSRFSFAVAPLPGMSVLRWRHPLFGWTECCMPLDHCVGILHLHRPRYRLCFDRRAHCHCLLSHSHPHCSLRHHCFLHHHCSLHHHQMKGCHPRFLLLAHRTWRGMSRVFGGTCLSLSRRSTPWGRRRRGPPRRWWRWRCLRLRQWSRWTRRRRSGRQWY